jgi:hypothetical protein
MPVSVAPPPHVGDPRSKAERKPLEQPGAGRRRTDRPEEPEYALLVPSENGYAIIMRHGSPPSPGETLEVSVEDRGEVDRFTVARVDRSLLPGRKICVYLLPE